MNETIVMSGYGIVGEPLSKKSTVHRKSVQGVRRGHMSLGIHGIIGKIFKTEC